MQILGDKQIRKNRAGFSLVEVLAAVAIIGVITFLALPNIITVRQDAEENLAITRAEAINMAIAAYIQSRGRTNAEAQWFATSNDQQKFDLLGPFLAFAPDNVGEYMPQDYHLTYPADLVSLEKVALRYDTDLDDATTGWAIGY